MLFAVTYNYSGYPLVKEARARVRSGGIGRVRKVVVEYSQGWLAELLEAEGHKQAEWRADPARGGPSAVLGDVGSHAHHLLRYVTGLEVRRLFADLGTVVEGRSAHDDAVVLLKLEGGARGVLMASQIATGERNHLRLRVYGSEGGLDWNQEEPNRLRLLRVDGSVEMLHRAAGAHSPAAAAATRLPGGHPEGFVEAFANIYREVARAVRGEPGRTIRSPTSPRFGTVPAVSTSSTPRSRAIDRTRGSTGPTIRSDRDNIRTRTDCPRSVRRSPDGAGRDARPGAQDGGASGGAHGEPCRLRGVGR